MERQNGAEGQAASEKGSRVGWHALFGAVALPVRVPCLETCLRVGYRVVWPGHPNRMILLG